MNLRIEMSKWGVILKSQHPTQRTGSTQHWNLTKKKRKLKRNQMQRGFSRLNLDFLHFQLWIKVNFQEKVVIKRLTCFFLLLSNMKFDKICHIFWWMLFSLVTAHFECHWCNLFYFEIVYCLKKIKSWFFRKLLIFLTIGSCLYFLRILLRNSKMRKLFIPLFVQVFEASTSNQCQSLTQTRRRRLEDFKISLKWFKVI